MITDLNSVNVAWLMKGLRPDETIKLVLKRHWIVFLYIGFYILFLIVSTFLLLISRSTIISVLPGIFFDIFIIFYWSVFLLFLYVVWINNELDLFVITDRRIRGIEQLSFLNRTISECAITDIEEVNAQTKGLMANIFNFGSVTMHTASEKSDFTMDYAPEPLDNASIILNVIQDAKGHVGKKE